MTWPFCGGNVFASRSGGSSQQRGLRHHVPRTAALATLWRRGARRYHGHAGRSRESSSATKMRWPWATCREQDIRARSNRPRTPPPALSRKLGQHAGACREAANPLESGGPIGGQQNGGHARRACRGGGSPAFGDELRVTRPQAPSSSPSSGSSISSGCSSPSAHLNSAELR